MPLTITILSIIGAITILCLFCLTAILVAWHLMNKWQFPHEQESKTTKQGDEKKIA